MSTPSSGPDILARLLNPKFSEAFGQPLVIDNRAGAAGIIGAEAKGTTAAEFAAHIRSETGKMRAAVTASGAKVE